MLAKQATCGPGMLDMKGAFKPSKKEVFSALVMCVDAKNLLVERSKQHRSAEAVVALSQAKRA